MEIDVQAQVSKSFYMPNAGVLDTLLKADVSDNVVSLTLSGRMNYHDLGFIRYYMPLLSYLDMSAVLFVDYADENRQFVFLQTPITIIMPNSISMIPDYAFSGSSSLKSITIPNTVTSIGNEAFNECTSLNNITIPNSVSSIESLAFFNCSSLSTVAIPNSVTFIGESAFGSCNGILSFFVQNENLNYCSVDGALFSKDKTKLIQYPVGKQDVNYVIPNSVTSIGSFAFAKSSSLYSITIPSSVTSIQYWSFYDCSALKTINCLNNKPPVVFDYDTFSGLTSVNDVFVPDAASVNAYKADVSWYQAFPGDIIKTKAINGFVFHVTVPPGTNACYISGAMNPNTFLEMARVDDTHYTIDINTNTPYGYKYYSGPDLAFVEADANNNDIPVRSYSSDDVVVKWKSVYSDIKTINSNYTKLISGKSTIRAEFDGNGRIEVCSLSGLLLRQAQATNTFTVDNLKAGLYIVKINGVAYKVVVR